MVSIFIDVGLRIHSAPTYTAGVTHPAAWAEHKPKAGAEHKRSPASGYPSSANTRLDIERDADDGGAFDVGLRWRSAQPTQGGDARRIKDHQTRCQLSAASREVALFEAVDKDPVELTRAALRATRFNDDVVDGPASLGDAVVAGQTETQAQVGEIVC